MRSRSPLPRPAAVLLVLLFVWLSAYSAPAQVRIPREAFTETAVLENVLQQGDALERSQRWGEALAHYEEALRRHPGVADLEQRMIVARFHYEIARRYADASFLQSLKRLGEAEALDLFSEVLLKIHAHYVEPPDWKELAHAGVSALEVSIQEPAFVRQHQLAISSATVQSKLQQIHRMLEARPVLSRHDVRDFALTTSRLAQRELGLSSQAVILEFCCAAGATLDEYSAFLTSSQLDDVMSQIEGNFVGLGIELKAEDRVLLIVNVIPQGPADRAGIRAGDRIVSVDGRATAEISTDAAADLLKGLEGSRVQLVVMSPQGTQRLVQLERRRVDVPSVENVALLDPATGIAYMRLSSFQKSTVRDVDAALWRLQRQGMRSLIVDVRNNPGGLLTASVDVADRFISQGPIVSTRGRSPGEDFDYQAHVMGTWRVPLIVLIDGNSASASEIFAGAIHDHQRGTLVGERSYGKGSVQGIFPLGVANTGLRLTTARFYSPSGQPICRRGVQPDVVVHSVAKPVDAGVLRADPTDDPALKAAVDLARQQLAAR